MFSKKFEQQSGGGANLLQSAVDNPDQRIARELDLWGTSLAELCVAVSTSLFNIAWYTIQTWLVTGWQGPALIFAFFVASTFFWVDPEEEIIGVQMTQMMPSSAYPMRVQFQQLAYAAIDW